MHESQSEVRDRYFAYAGEPVSQFTWLGRYDSWEPLGRDQLVISTGVSDAYLIKVQQPCPDLQFAQRIGLTSTSHTVYSRLDSVLAGQDRCQIAEIRKVDYRRMRADMRLEAQSRKTAAQTP